jgi:hypothetical protein
MADHQRLPSEPQRVRGGNCTIRNIGELEIPHGVEPNHPDPIGHEGVFTSLRGEHSAFGVRNHPGAEPAKYDGSKMMIGMVMSEYQPSDGLPGDTSNGSHQLFALLRAGQRVDDNDALARDHEARVGPPLGAPPGVSDCGIHIRRQTANGRCGVRRRAGQVPG